MMFAGLTSAFIVKSNQSTWMPVEVPRVFWLSTAVIVVSSIAMQMALRSFKQRGMQQYRLLMGLTLLLGAAFIIMQWLGFQQLWDVQNITFKGGGAGQFLYVIFGLHALHVLGGVIALIVMFIRAFAGRTKLYSAVPVEVAATYWHFVDLLWVYIMVFFLAVG
ncbi:MAG: heme-copper oxidase subunit III [Bacteroidetes bacterium]|nr:heme-copper oxidase subunit III [Bacteroidota bacterium]